MEKRSGIRGELYPSDLPFLFLTQMKNQFLNTKNTGDTVISTLNANLQNVAYNAWETEEGLWL